MTKAKDDGFCNVDLEIIARSRAQLVPLIEQLEAKLFLLFAGRVRGRYLVSYESCGPSMISGRRRRNASIVIHELADVIDGLSASGKRAWNAAAVRDFNVGIEIARGSWMTEHVVEPEAVRRVAALGGRVVFTAYQLAAIRRRSARKRVA